MASLVKGKKGYLVIQFRYRRQLCREYTGKLDSRDNRRDLKATVSAITREIKDKSFDYAKRFPQSRMLVRFGLVQEKTGGLVRLGEQARIWLATQDLSADTRRDYEYLFRVYLDNTKLGAMPFDSVRPDHLRQVVRESKSVRRATMFMQRLRSIYSVAVDDGMLERNPAERVRNPKRRGRQETVEPWTAGWERQAIYEAAAGADRAIISLVMGNGLRLGEALALRRQDVDLKTRKIAVTGAVYRAREKETKTEGSARTIDIIDDVLPVTAALQSVADRLGPLFPNARGGYIDLANWRVRTWKGLLEQAGLKYRNPNMLRHSFAVAMIQLGHTPDRIARMMGHTGPQMVFRHYARWMVSESDQKSDQTRGRRQQ